MIRMLLCIVLKQLKSMVIGIISLHRLEQNEQ